MDSRRVQVEELEVKGFRFRLCHMIRANHRTVVAPAARLSLRFGILGLGCGENPEPLSPLTYTSRRCFLFVFFAGAGGWWVWAVGFQKGGAVGAHFADS